MILAGSALNSDWTRKCDYHEAHSGFEATCINVSISRWEIGEATNTISSDWG